MHRPTSTRGAKHKPSKGQRMRMGQERRSRENAKLRNQPRPAIDEKPKLSEKLREQFARLQRWFTLTKHLKGRYTPHQGVQECERRVRQRAEGKCIHGRDYPHGQQA